MTTPVEPLTEATLTTTLASLASLDVTSDKDTTSVPKPIGGLIDTKDGVRALAAWLLAQTDLEVAFDAEGIDLSRDGRLCLLQLSDGATTWLVDVVVLGRDAFEDGGLKAVLESESILKVGYDGRADSDALCGQFDVRMANLYDVQIASCKRQDREQGRRDRFVHGLGKATAAFLTTNPRRARELEAIKQTGLKAFAPEKGGSYEVWAARPLAEALITYATADVALLLEMKGGWAKFSPVAENVATSSKRMAKAVNGNAAAKGRHMAVKDF